MVAAMETWTEAAKETTFGKVEMVTWRVVATGSWMEVVMVMRRVVVMETWTEEWAVPMVAAWAVLMVAAWAVAHHRSSASRASIARTRRCPETCSTHRIPATCPRSYSPEQEMGLQVMATEAAARAGEEMAAVGTGIAPVGSHRYP